MRFSAAGRMLAAANVIVLPAIGAWEVLKGADVGLAAYCISSAVLLGLVEVPSLCTCMKCCIIVGKYTRYLNGYWLSRALVNVGVSAGGLAIYVNTDQRDPWELIGLITCLVCAALYLFGRYVRHEEDPNPWAAAAIENVKGKAGGFLPMSVGADKSGAGDADKPTKSAGGGGGFAAFFGRSAAKAAMANPEATASLVAAAAPSAAELMFGGGGSSSPAEKSALGGFSTGASVPKGFYDEEEGGGRAAPSHAVPSAPAPNLFSSGGGLFGGSSGVGSGDDPEDNPFRS